MMKRNRVVPWCALLLTLSLGHAVPAAAQVCADADGDGYGNPPSRACASAFLADCDDTRPAVHPGAVEVCDGLDDDCNGVIPAAERDADGDGVRLCDVPADCNDFDVAMSPTQSEVCGDKKDNDCDGQVDEAGCVCPDADGDGATVAVCGGTDCNDADAAIHPGATEVCNDAKDNDCNGQKDCADGACAADAGCLSCLAADADGDGYATLGGICGAIDCDDADVAIHPGAAEICDGKDSNCDGSKPATDVDSDGDGYAVCANDCNDGDPAVHPGATEECNGRDDDCNGTVPASERDFDRDGVRACDVPADCNDMDAAQHPGNVEVCADGKDNDCDGQVDDAGCTCPDADGDGATAAVCGGTDCNDANAAIHPGAVEVCDDHADNDCNGQQDCADSSCATDAGCVNCAATDGDSDGYSTAGGACGAIDCDDADPAIHPGAAEICDGKDSNCDGATPLAEADADGDGVPRCAGDCDDSDASRHPGAIEACDGVDNDCNGLLGPQERDADGDGVLLCDVPADCNDFDARAYPGNVELCLDGIDNDCDPATGDDPADGLCQCPDADGDGVTTCDGDCDDGDAAVFPGATEVCTDGIDNDCNGLTDLADEVPCLAGCPDGDLDGYKDANCGGSDCDDTDFFVNPGAIEVCDGVDTNCDGVRPATDVDNDGDGVALCANDCDDTNVDIYPGHPEICDDGLDNDCNGQVDANDGACALPTCATITTPKEPPHVSDLLNPDGTLHPDAVDLRCGKCHEAGPDGQEIPGMRYQCQRCHADPSDPSDPLNGVLKVAYPLPYPYGYGSAQNVKTHSSTTTSAKYGPWDVGCVNCHNPHLQEQNHAFGTSYGKLIKRYICFDNQATGGHIEGLVEFTAPTGLGSFADGPPHDENVCEHCHTQTNHHQNDGTAPGGQSHNDGAKCTDCHPHADGFAPTGGEPQAPHNTQFFLDNCQFCHVAGASGGIDFSAAIPDAECKKCHGARKAHSSDAAKNPEASGLYTYDFGCVDCHDPMFSVGANRKLLREQMTGSVVPGSQVVNTARSGDGSLADPAADSNQNVCETCHAQTAHNRHDGSGSSAHLDGQNHDGAYCMVCHDHNRAFMKPGPSAEP